ncbi:MAG TPA: hypothetical protein VNN74_02850 [Candidatus Micrarchaeia archaeon]|nr:hypothetical protein [Candidatus Micrarchaeia archaeon]
MHALRRVLRTLAAPGFARRPPLGLRVAPEVLGGLLGIVALVAAVGNAGALAAVLASLVHPGSLGGWLPALATLVGAAVGLAGDVLVGLGAFALSRLPRLGAELVVVGLLLALAATLMLGATGGSLLAALVYVAALVLVYLLVVASAAGRPEPAAEGEAGGDVPPSGGSGPARAPVPWILPAEPRQPQAWRRPDAAGSRPSGGAGPSPEPGVPAGTPGDSP